MQAIIQPSPADTPNRHAALIFRPAEWQPTAGLQSLDLLDYTPGLTISIIRTLREITGLGLAECKRRVEAPRPLL